MSVSVTESTFKDVVLEAKVPVVVDFWAEWCGPCKKLSPVLEEISQELGEKVVVAKVNVDEERTLGATFQIMSIPTLLFFKDGKHVGQSVGVRPKTEIVAKLESLM